WLAEPAVKELLREAPGVEVIWRAFELRPEPVPTLPPGGEYLQRAWESRVYPLAERLGVEVRLPPVPPGSRRGHEAAKWAGEQGRFDEMNEAVFRAFFERGEDIGQVEVLARLAESLGLDGGALRSALEERRFEAAVAADEREAERMGLGG